MEYTPRIEQKITMQSGLASLMEIFPVLLLLMLLFWYKTFQGPVLSTLQQEAFASFKSHRIVANIANTHGYFFRFCIYLVFCGSNTPQAFYPQGQISEIAFIPGLLEILCLTCFPFLFCMSLLQAILSIVLSITAQSSGRTLRSTRFADVFDAIEPALIQDDAAVYSSNSWRTLPSDEGYTKRNNDVSFETRLAMTHERGQRII